MNTRRQFLLRAPLGVLVAATACRNETPSTNSQSTPSTAAAVIGRRHRLRTSDAIVEMDRVAATHIRAGCEYLSQSHRTVGSEDQIDHHADQRSRARAGESG